MNKEESAAKVAELKEEGNKCMKDSKPMEAVIHYSHALKIDKNQYQIYSNRSLAFLKLEQYYFSLEDANKAIEINPSWAKGYYRKGEVYRATEHFKEAIEAFKKALSLEPDDSGIKKVLQTAMLMYQNKVKSDTQQPWIGGACGFILGIGIVLGDQFVANKPSIINPVVQALLTIVFSILAYAITRVIRYFKNTQKTSLLEPPLDLLGDSNSKIRSWDEDNDEPKTSEESSTSTENKDRTRFSKSQARQRFKKGKQ